MLFGSRARAEAARFLEKALKLLTRADIMLGVGLNESAGRNAYLAAFHAAQAYIFENAAKVLKTHNGVQAEFPRLTKDDPRIDAELRLFLSRAHNLKAIADYETGTGSEFPPSARRAPPIKRNSYINNY
jgi:uncharacterized protein (UPF0332 family)